MQKTDWKFETWREAGGRHGAAYVEYWNDEEIERTKPWYVLNGDFGPMERYLDSTGLPDDLRHCAAALKRQSGTELSGSGIDLAAGNLWAVPQLLGLGPINRIWCLEYSHHRLAKLGPALLEHYGVSVEKVTLVLGSFYDLKLPEGSLDFAFVSQGFHHADRPRQLLREIERVLRPGGVLIMIGEHVVTRSEYLRYLGKVGASFLPSPLQRRMFGRRLDVRRTVAPQVADIHPPDPEAGDHYYSARDYAEMFDQTGMEWMRLRRRGATFQSFVLAKPRQA